MCGVVKPLRVKRGLMRCRLAKAGQREVLSLWA
jgi:hypothetical protein